MVSIQGLGIDRQCPAVQTCFGWLCRVERTGPQGETAGHALAQARHTRLYKTRGWQAQRLLVASKLCAFPALRGLMLVRPATSESLSSPSDRRVPSSKNSFACSRKLSFPAHPVRPGSVDRHKAGEVTSVCTSCELCVRFFISFDFSFRSCGSAWWGVGEGARGMTAGKEGEAPALL